MMCGVLSTVSFLCKGIKNKRWAYVFLVYGVWILIKAFWGYAAFGPLAFRHAAMFYYAFFSVFLFSSINDQEIPTGGWVAFFVFLLMLVKSFNVRGYFVMMYLTACALCLVQFKGGRWKFPGLLAMVWVFSLFRFFQGGTSFVLGNVGAVVAFLAVSFFAAKKTCRRVKFFFGTGILFLIVLGVVFIAPRWETKTIATPLKILTEYRRVDAFIHQEKFSTFAFDEITPQIYHRNVRAQTLVLNDAKKQQGKPSLIKQKQAPIAKKFEPVKSSLSQSEKSAPPLTQFAASLFDRIPVEDQKRLSRVAYNNVLFRLFLWRDMALEFFSDNVVTGVPFGRPFRSRSIEIIQQAKSEWSRDGWIEPHNSFLNMIYRGGIVGVLLVGMMIFWIGRFFVVFAKAGSYRGIMMTSVLVQWNIVACFMVIYELPKYAIPIWIWWGITYFYYKKQKSVLLHEDINYS